MYLFYIMWQWFAYKRGLKLHAKYNFDNSHHVTWGSVQLGSFLYKLPVPFIFGPAGGGQKSPVAFKKYFGSSWAVEEKRNRISDLLLMFNPACKSMLKKASAIWVSNPDTLKLVQKQSATPAHYTLDAALALNFFPSQFKPKSPQEEVLNLLWVGRLMPRKGVLLLLDVMEKLKDNPGIKLTIVGDGEQREILKATIAEKGLQNTVVWKGKVPFEEVKQYYQSHDVFFFTSLRDSCPAQLIEAMAFGMPVITLNLHGQAIIVNDETGFRCACDSPEQAIGALQKAIITLYKDSSLVTSMSLAAHDFALKQTWDFKIENIVKQSYPDKSTSINNSLSTVEDTNI
jgi:glycosyltransferase involved in cell wall biosynthesis